MEEQVRVLSGAHRNKEASLKEKECTGCKKTRLLIEFNFRNKSKGTYSSRCKQCTRTAIRAHYENNKSYYVKKARKSKIAMAKWHKEYKSERECILCGEDHIATLVFHHRVPSKKSFAIPHGLVRYSKKRILEEMEKCDVLCANCHRILHYNMRV